MIRNYLIILAIQFYILSNSSVLSACNPKIENNQCNQNKNGGFCLVDKCQCFKGFSGIKCDKSSENLYSKQ